MRHLNSFQLKNEAKPTKLMYIIITEDLVTLMQAQKAVASHGKSEELGVSVTALESEE
jgi:hypothetical protein